MLNTILPLAKQLIAIPSTGANLAARKEVLALAADQLPAFTIETYESHGAQSLLVHNRALNAKQFKIILNAHLDVIPGKEKQYIPYEKEGKLYARGAYDMKAAAAVMIVLFKELASHVPYPLALQLTTDEENGSYGTAKQVNEGLRSEFIITGECGSNFRITNQAKGAYHVKITATGKTSHGAYPWLGDNALLKLHKALSTISKSYPSPKEETHNTTVNITRFNTSNQATNQTPDYCEAYLDIRYMPKDKHILEEIKRLLPEGVIIESFISYAPLDTDPNNKYIQLLQHVGQQLFQKPFTYRMAHATSDVVRFAEVGCEGIEFGPIGGGQHHDDEWVDIQSLSDYYEILKTFLLQVE